MKNTIYDIFITHAWRYHEDWTRVGELLDDCSGLNWRNFSVPWHDPAMDPNSEVGGRFIRSWLESQIVPAAGVLLLNSVYATNSARHWITLEIEMARRHGKPVIALPSFGEADVLPEVRALADSVARWDGVAIIGAIEATRH